MQEKNEQNLSKFPDADYFLKEIQENKDLYIKNMYWEVGATVLKIVDTTDYGKSEMRVERPYQETSDDCTGNLFKKK